VSARSTRELVEAATLRYLDREHCVAWHENVQLVFSIRAPSTWFVERIVSEQQVLGARCDCGTGTLLVIQGDVPPSSDEASAYIGREMARSAVVAMAYVVEGVGFRGASTRAVLSRLHQAIRPPYAMKIFGDVSVGAFWLARELRLKAGVAPDGPALAQTTRAVRSRFVATSMPPARD
jgi:hypothetical protein